VTKVEALTCKRYSCEK